MACSDSASFCPNCGTRLPETAGAADGYDQNSAYGQGGYGPAGGGAGAQGGDNYGPASGYGQGGYDQSNSYGQGCYDQSNSYSQGSYDQSNSYGQNGYGNYGYGDGSAPYGNAYGAGGPMPGAPLPLRRSIALCIIFSIITCGIYDLYWMAKMNDELRALAGEPGTSGGMVVLFSLITFGIYELYWYYQMGKLVDRVKRSPSENTGILYLILALFSVGIISDALMQDALNSFTPYA